MNLNKKANSLIHEESDYLLQHAYNPINWYTWSDEAFKKAINENKLIFLSIGYSSCHWCHVMDKESFEDEEVAEVLNNNYVSIKVDKEDRPDINYIYMTACKYITGHEGWPLTIIMTPDKLPFIAGTYFPKKTRYNRIGLIDLLESTSERWKDNKEEIIQKANYIVKQVKNYYTTDDECKIIMPEMLDDGYRELKNNYEPEYGGFAYAPKFPAPHKLMFLIEYYRYTKNKEALEMVEHTLRCMYQGGIFDHIEGGFCRYSTDKRWLVPHFEKMLYDNALLIIAYLECYKETNDSFYKDVALDCLDYVFINLNNEDGGFYSAQDSDSEGEEGRYYTFTYEEILDVLGEVDGKKFCQIYNISQRGNFDERNIPNLINSVIDVSEVTLKQWKDKIKRYKKQRSNIKTETKIITSFNGIMIVALSKAYEILKDNKYLDYANKTLKFILNNIIDKSGRLMVNYNKRIAKQKAIIDDYAYFIYGLISLYEVTKDEKYLEQSLKFNKKAMDIFYDNSSAGFYYYGKDSEQLIARPKDLYDTDKPSGNSIMGYNLIKLSRYTGSLELTMIAERQMNFIASNLHGGEENYTFFLYSVKCAIDN